MLGPLFLLFLSLLLLFSKKKLYNWPSKWSAENATKPQGRWQRGFGQVLELDKKKPMETNKNWTVFLLAKERGEKWQWQSTTVGRKNWRNIWEVTFFSLRLRMIFVQTCWVFWVLTFRKPTINNRKGKSKMKGTSWDVQTNVAFHVICFGNSHVQMIGEYWSSWWPLFDK